MKKKILKLSESDRIQISNRITSEHSTISNLLKDVINTPVWLSNLLDMKEKEFYEFFISDKLQQRLTLKEKGCDNIFDCLTEINDFFPKLKKTLETDRNIERYVKDRVMKIRTILQDQRISP
jgi:hypothetical protein